MYYTGEDNHLFGWEDEKINAISSPETEIYVAWVKIKQHFIPPLQRARAS